ncbi:ATP-dependent helicase [Candidatus Nomurabacteria bacterium]|nr:ATP-dependent helicase [Candidatus Nomurabacteria bacterium]
MVLYVLEELVKNQDLKADIQEKYQYILVDEHQDTNEGQNTLIEFLTDALHLEGKPNIFTVGDEKQSIYRFQGASVETFSKFKNLYKEINLITLTENYRSTQNILDGAHSLIVKSHDLERSVELHSNIKQNEKIIIRDFSNYKFELLYLAEDIKKRISDGVLPSEIAVLYRANKNVSDIKTIFDFYKIDYTIFSRDKILDDPNIKNLVYILKVIYNPNDDHNLGKVFFAKFLNFDAYDVVRILEKFKSLRKKDTKHIFSIIEDKKNLKEIEVKNVDNFLNFARILKKLKIESQNQNFPDFFKMFLTEMGYIKYMLSSSDSRLQIARLDKFLDEIKRQNQTKRDYGLLDFIYFVDAFAKYNLDINTTDPEIIEGVSLMTAHSSKGREFEYVYIVNATRNSWEGGRNGGGSITLPIYQYDGDIEDERRLFYVAMTRAKKILNISYARTDNDGKEHEESEFVKEIDTSFKKEIKMKEFEEKNIENLSLFLHSVQSSASIFEPKYLRDLFFKRGLNVSALNNYLSCPKKYLYKNLIRIPDVYSPTMKFGDLIHKSLELFFSASTQTEKILPKEELLHNFERELIKNYFSEKDEEKFRERGEQALSLFYDEYANTWIFKVKTEFNIKKDFELDNGEILRLTGFVDKMEENNEDGSINIVDYKTGRTFSEKAKEEKADYERQIVFYHLLLQDYDNGQLIVNKSMLDFVEKNKKGNFEQYSFSVTKEHLEKLSKEINTFSDEILSMEFFKKGCNKKDCEWCNM